jgi:hypothetical protein
VPRLRLIRARLVTSTTQIHALVRQFDALPRFPQRAYSCPADDGSAIVAKLAYPGRHLVTVDVGLTGCRIVTNGSIRRTALGIGSTHEASVVALLERLVPAA